MPEVSRFYGLTIHFFYDDHNPPHFHVYYGSRKAVFSIQTLEMLEGKIPKKAALMVVQWAFLHRQELYDCWNMAKQGQVPNKIKPLR